MKNKVCHISSAHPPKDGRIFKKECVSLASAGYDVSLVVQGESEEAEGVHIVGAGIPPISRISRILTFTKKVYHKALAVDADIYHVHDPELLFYALKLKKKGKKVIFDSHEFCGMQIMERTYIPKFLRSVISCLYMKFETRVCRRLDAVVQVCTLQGNDYFKGRCKQSIFLCNYPDLDAFKMDSSQKFEKDDAVIHIGALTHERGITDLVKAARFTHSEIRLAGKFDSDAYEQKVRNLQEFEKVRYLGFLNKQEIPTALGKCFAGISTLLNVGQYDKIDTLPTKIYEYLLMGLPVIISNTPYNKRMNDQYHFGICVDPAASEQIAEAIDMIRDNPELGRQMGENGRELVLKIFNWNREKEKLLSLYQKILNIN